MSRVEQGIRLSTPSDIKPEAYRGSKIIILGAGAAGLATADTFAKRGADEVVLLEKRLPSESSESGDRSIMIVLGGGVAEEVRNPLLLRNSGIINGRRVYPNGGQPFDFDFPNKGRNISREDLNLNLSEIVAGHPNVKVVYGVNTSDERIDFDRGIVTYYDSDKGEEVTDKGDLVIAARGTSITQALSANPPEGVEVNRFSYVSVDSVSGDIASDRIQLWQGRTPDHFAVGLPVPGMPERGEVVVVFPSGSDKDRHPFVDQERFAHEFPQLAASDQGLAERLPQRPVGRIITRLRETPVLGEKGVAIGEEHAVFLFFANGVGTDFAMTGGPAVERAIAMEGGDVKAGIVRYGGFAQEVAGLLMDASKAQDVYVNAGMWERGVRPPGLPFGRVLTAAEAAMQDR